MAYVTENDYKKMAEAISTDLISNKVALNDSISKLASSMDLSHEQIRRLCEATNNVTFNQLFQSKDKTASDRIIEFDVADPDKILGSLIKKAEHISEFQQDAISLLEYRSLRDDVQPPETTKEASLFELRPEPRVNKEANVRTIRKTLDFLRSEKIATELAFIDAISGLHKEFRKLYRDTSFEKFEKSAAVIHGTDAVPVLDALRAKMKLPEVNYDFTVLQKYAGVIDDSAIEFKMFADAVNTHQKLVQVIGGIKHLEQIV